MLKKGILVAVLMCSLSMTGCIVINTGKDDSNGSGTSSNTQQTQQVQQTQQSQNNNYSNNNESNYSSTQAIAKADTAYEVDEYVFYDSASRYLTSSDLVGLSKWELKIARNEIYARHGRRFNDKSLQNYFDSCSWYDGYISANDFDDDSLSKVEQHNVNFIKKFE